MKKSLVRNSLLYSVKTMVSLVVPIITYPYICRVLGVDILGRYSFSQSIISYASLIASLGISTYAIREGAKIREDANIFSTFASNIFSLNIYSTWLSFTLLMIAVFSIQRLRNINILILLCSITIPLTTMGTEWVFSVYEEYEYITYRSLAFQILSFAALFIFIHSPEDIYKYALINVVASAGSNVFNFIKARNYFEHKIVLDKSIVEHIKPIMVLFAAIIASQIYVNLDITMLGFMKGDTDVGIYTSATKMYNMLRQIITSIIAVLLPRLSYSSENKETYKCLFSKTFSYYSVISMPVCVGISCISELSIELFSGRDYIDAALSLRILGGALLFSTLGSFIANSVLIVNNREKVILIATCCGAAFNLIGNFILIPLYSYNGAAITTIISEIIVFMIQFASARRFVDFHMVNKDFLKSLMSAFGIILITLALKNLTGGLIVKTICNVVLSALLYGILLIIFKHPACIEIICAIKHKVKI